MLLSSSQSSLHRGRWLALAISVLSTGACLQSDPENSKGQMCEVDSDCDGPEVCDEGVCWGDPPPTESLALVLIPPSDRTDLAPREVTQIDIASDGTLSGLSFGASVEVSGQVRAFCHPELCSEPVLIPAQIIFERPASFSGGPPLRRSVITNPQVRSGEDSFRIRLPADNESYRVTVIPDESAIPGIASQVPLSALAPFSTTIVADGDQTLTWELGRPDELKHAEGCIESGTGNGSPYAGMRVTAFGRWAEDEAPMRASAVVTTGTSGCFSLSVPIAMEDRFDFVVRPGPGAALPTIRLSNLDWPDPDENQEISTLQLAPLQMPSAANPATFQVPVIGASSGGELEPVVGASVLASTSFQPAGDETRELDIRFTASAVTGEDGLAQLDLFPGSTDNNRSYSLRVVPPTDSVFAAFWNVEIEVGPGGAPVLRNVELVRRVPVSGSLLTYEGTPLGDTPIAVEPSQSLRDELADGDEALALNNLQFPSTLTGPDGDFLLWLDALVLDSPAEYDLAVSPSDFSTAPRWRIPDIAPKESAPPETLSLGAITLPPASYARGSVTDPQGEVVVGAELRWYRVLATSCEDEETCDYRADLIGIWESDEAGNTIAVLPDID